MLSRVCKICGCTERQPCIIDLANDIHCAWADEQRTICTGCLPKLPGTELTALANREIVRLQDADVELLLTLSPVEAISLCSLLQLAQRHPELAPGAPNVAEYCQRFIDALASGFEEFPAVSELIRRGDDPQFDLKVIDKPPRASSLILP